MTLSLIMIVKNEEENIASCLESVKGLADEIIVVDDMSTDGTAAIAEKYGAKVFQRKFDSFTLQKGFALSKATSDWVLNLDADESLTPGLKEEIKNTISNTDKNGFWIKINNEFLGRVMKHSGLYGQQRFRLARRAGATYEGGKVHETLTISGPTGVLNAAISHRPYKTIEQYFKKFNSYTTLAAESMFEKGKKFSAFQLLRPPFDFIKLYIFRLGILDGPEGFLWAYFSSQYAFVKYSKLWHLQKEKK